MRKKRVETLKKKNSREIIIYICIILALILVSLSIKFLTGNVAKTNLEKRLLEIEKCNNDGICGPEENRDNCLLDCKRPAPTNENALCLYNKNDEISSEICDYYLEKRPGASKFGLDLNEGDFRSGDYGGQRNYYGTYEVMNKEIFDEKVIAPLLEYINSHQNIHITHLAIAKGLPIAIHMEKVCGRCPDRISTMKYFNNPDNARLEYPSLNKRLYEHFNPEDYKNSNGDYYVQFVVSYLNAYTLDDVKKMIDKAVAPAPNMDEVNWILDRDEDGFSISEKFMLALKASFLKNTLNTNIIIDSNNGPDVITSENPIIGYIGPGKYHSGYRGGMWVSGRTPAGNKIFDLETANRAIFASIESYNARTFTGTPRHLYWTDDFAPGYPAMPTGHQGKLADAFSPESFAGESYSGSFSGAIGHVDEPGLTGAESYSKRFFDAYIDGLTLAESALFASQLATPVLVAGDPLMKLYDSDNIKLKNGEICVNDLQCSSGNCDISLSDISEKRCHANADNCVFGSSSNNMRTYASGNAMSEGNEIINGGSYCSYKFDAIFSCIEGEWQKTEASPGYECEFTSYEPPAFNTRWNQVPGATCEENEQCASGICKEDLQGVKRCIKESGNCIVDSEGYEVPDKNFICTDELHKRMCANGEWIKKEALCPWGCDNGKCIGEFFTLPATLNIKKNQHYTFSIPFKPKVRYVHEMFPEEDALQLSVWDAESKTYRSIEFVDGAWEGSGATSLASPGTVVWLYSNKDMILNLESDPIDSPEDIKIKGEFNFISIPACANKYTASDVLAEIMSLENLNDAPCYAVSQLDSGSNPSYWNYDLERGLRGKRADFNIRAYEPFTVYCRADADFIWKPSCNPKELFPNRIYKDSYKTIELSETESKLYIGPHAILINKKIKDPAEFSVVELKREQKPWTNEDSYLIINNLILEEGITKTIYLEKNNPLSNSVCIRDENNLEDVNDIKANCISIDCPGELGDYSCDIQNGKFIVRGLKHSGVVETTTIPLCTENDWQASLSPPFCPPSEKQIKTWNKINQCHNGVDKPETEEASCTYVKILKKEDLLLRTENNKTFVIENTTNSTLIFFDEEDSLNFDNVSIVLSSDWENISYIIVNNLSLINLTKSLYLKTSNESYNAICVADKEGLNEKRDILSNCTLFSCPGNSGNYSCGIENLTFIVSGLIHSGVIESYIEPLPDEEPPAEDAGSNRGNTGGSSSGGGGLPSANLASCNSDWQCTLSECINGFQQTLCEDLNSCNISIGAPLQTTINCNLSSEEENNSLQDSNKINLQNENESDESSRYLSDKKIIVIVLSILAISLITALLIIWFIKSRKKLQSAPQ